MVRRAFWKCVNFETVLTRPDKHKPGGLTLLETELHRTALGPCLVRRQNMPAQLIRLAAAGSFHTGRKQISRHLFVVHRARFTTLTLDEYAKAKELSSLDSVQQLPLVPLPFPLCYPGIMLMLVAIITC